MELASDSKDFSTALAKTRLAEMGKHKIVPILQRKLLSKKGMQIRDAAKKSKEDIDSGRISVQNTLCVSIYLCFCCHKYIIFFVYDKWDIHVFSGVTQCSATQTEPVKTNIANIHYEVPNDQLFQSNPAQFTRMTERPVEIIAMPQAETNIEVNTFIILLSGI